MLCPDSLPSEISALSRPGNRHRILILQQDQGLAIIEPVLLLLYKPLIHYSRALSYVVVRCVL